MATKHVGLHRYLDPVHKPCMSWGISVCMGLRDARNQYTLEQLSGHARSLTQSNPQRRHLKEPLRAYVLRASQPTGGGASHPNVHAHPTLLHSNKPGLCLIYQMGNLLVQGPPIDPSSLLLRNHSFSWPAPPHHPQPAPKPLNHRL